MDRSLGRLLGRMRDGELFLHLGFVRLADYLSERLGLSLRTAQELIRVDRALSELPRAAAAYEDCRLSTAHVRLLSRVATPDNEAFWVGRACRMSVRALRRAVEAHLERDRISRQGGPPPIGAPASPADSGPAGATGPHREAMFPPPTPEGEEEEEPVPMAIPSPVWVIRWWRETVTLAGMVAGQALSAGGALDLLLAESEDAIPAADDPAGTSGGGAGAVGNLMGLTAPGPEHEPAAPSSAEGPSGSGGVPSERVTPLSREPCEATAPQQEKPQGLRPGGTAASSRTPASYALRAAEARRLDVELFGLITLRQRCELRLADHLACVRAARRYAMEGFRSMEQYAARMLGLSPRRMRYLLALHRTLEGLGDLRRAFLDGRLTLRQTLLVGRLATRETAGAWIRRAGAVTLRRLEDEVAFWELLRDERPEVWETLQGGPLPEGIVLVPGHEPRLRESPGRLHVSAREAGDREEDTVAPHIQQIGLHVSARPGQAAARELLDALERSEAATPLPPRMGTLRMRVDPETRRRWSLLVTRLREGAGGSLEEWEVLALVIRRFWQVWDSSETRKQRRRNPTLERDGWRCTVPGCRAMGSGRLHEHHIVFRSAGGALTDPANLTTLCTAHHQRLLHRGIVRCRGTAPDDLRWELGVEPGRPSFLFYEGDRRIGGTAPSGGDPKRIQHGMLASVTPLRH